MPATANRSPHDITVMAAGMHLTVWLYLRRAFNSYFSDEGVGGGYSFTQLNFFESMAITDMMVMLHVCAARDIA